jgi:hypothetical protein
MKTTFSPKTVAEVIQELGTFEQATSAGQTSGTGTDFTGLLTNGDGQTVLLRTAQFLDSKHRDECLWQLRLESIRLRAKLGGIVMRMTMPCGGPVTAREGLVVCCESQTHITARLIPIQRDGSGSFTGWGKSVSMQQNDHWWTQLISTIGWLVAPAELLDRNFAATLALAHKDNISLVRRLLGEYEAPKIVAPQQPRVMESAREVGMRTELLKRTMAGISPHGAFSYQPQKSALKRGAL